MDAVVNPQAVAPVRHQSELAQLRQMPRDVRLGRAKGIGQLADAELLVLHEQHQTAQARVVGERGEELFGINIHKKEYTVYGIYFQMNV